MGRTELARKTGAADGLRPESFNSAENVKQPTFEGSSDLELIGAIVSRDQRAFAELFRRHYRLVMWSSQTILVNTAESEDVAAEVLFNFWLEPEKFDPSRGTLLSYLRVKAKGRSVDIVRAEASRYRRERNHADRSGAVELGVDARIISIETKVRLREALAQLSTEERESIELAYFGGLTYVAVAQHLGEPEGTVKSRIRSGMGRLRSACAAEDISGAQGLDINDPQTRR